MHAIDFVWQYARLEDLLTGLPPLVAFCMLPVCVWRFQGCAPISTAYYVTVLMCHI